MEKPIYNHIYLIKNKREKKTFLALCDYTDMFSNGDFYICINMIKSHKINKNTSFSKIEQINFARYQEFDFTNIEVLDTNYEILEDLGFIEELYKIKNTTEDYSKFKNSISPKMIDDFFANIINI